MVQRQRLPETRSGPLGRFQVFGDEGRNAVEGPGYVNWDFSAFKNIRADRIQRISIPRRVVQCSEPYQFPHAGQRHRIADLRANSVRCRPAGDSGGAEVLVLAVACQSGDSLATENIPAKSHEPFTPKNSPTSPPAGSPRCGQTLSSMLVRVSSIKRIDTTTDLDSRRNSDSPPHHKRLRHS